MESLQHSDVISREQRKFILGCLTFIYAISFVDRQIVSILIEPIKNDLMLTDTQLGLMSGFAFALFYATLGIPIAAIADRGNRKNIIAISLALFSAMTVLCGTATTFAQMLFYRMGVGVGEAGTSPPSHSIISDLYGPESRSSAMSIFALGAPIGIFLGFAIGGLVAHLWGWRTAFWVAGLPGIAMSLLTYFFVKEPRRGLSEKPKLHTEIPPKFITVLVLLWHKRSAFHLIMGATIVLFSGYSFTTWASSFLIRSYNIGLTSAGIALATTIGIGGAIGAISSGFLADKLRKRDVRWPCWMICIAITLSIPFSLTGYAVNSLYFSLFLLMVPAIVASFYFGPTMAMLHGVVVIEARAITSAITLFIINLIALGLGPAFTGYLSDCLEGYFAHNSLRYALMIISIMPLWAVYHFYSASKHISRDTNSPLKY